jgi:broad specificity phosphatase PhoE
MNKDLLERLRGGGYILYVRHGATFGRDMPNMNFHDCLTQRNLSEKGRSEAIRYGEILRSLRIPVASPVTASPFCRTIETARLAFGQTDIETDPYWFDVYRLSGDLSPHERDLILNELPAKLETVPPAGKNSFIIAHGFPEGEGLGDIPEMGTVIVKPLGEGNGYEIISKLTLDELADP